MEVKVEFPDHALSESPTVGGVFRIPRQIDEEDGSEGSDFDRPRRYIRPQSAKGAFLYFCFGLVSFVWQYTYFVRVPLAMDCNDIHLKEIKYLGK